MSSGSGEIFEELDFVIDIIVSSIPALVSLPGCAVSLSYSSVEKILCAVFKWGKSNNVLLQILHVSFFLYFI